MRKRLGDRFEMRKMTLFEDWKGSNAQGMAPLGHPGAAAGVDGSAIADSEMG